MGGRGAKAEKGVLTAKSKKTLENLRKRGTKIVNEAPKGYTELTGATTAPLGYTWYYNGKSLFSGERKTVLVKNKR